MSDDTVEHFPGISRRDWILIDRDLRMNFSKELKKVYEKYKKTMIHFEEEYPDEKVTIQFLDKLIDDLNDNINFIKSEGDSDE